MEVFQDFEYEIKTLVGEKEGDSPKKVLSLGKYLGNETSVVIPDEIEGYPVTEMNYTFSWKEELESVTLPPKLETLGVATFQGCTKLKAIHLPSSLENIGHIAFQNCTSLEKITVSDHVALIETLSLTHLTFENCPNLCDENGFIILKTLLLAYQGSETKVTIPDGITKISEAAFWENPTVTSVVMPDSVVTVGRWAFHQCVNLTEIRLSKELKTISEEAFSNCKKLEQISLPDQVKEIEARVFSGCGSLKEIGWSGNLKGILDGAFKKCTSLEEISFPDTLNYIQKSFSGCINLRKITIPSSVDSISKKAFETCDSLEIIEILDRPEGTKKLDLPISCFPYSGKMRENVLSQGQEVPYIIAETFTKTHTQQYLSDLFRSWEQLSEEAKDLFRKEWKKEITFKVKKGMNHIRNLVFFESTAKEMGIYFKEGFHLELPELEEYLKFSIVNENTAETAVLLDYKNKTFSKEHLEAINTRKELIDIGLEPPTLVELHDKWEVKVKKTYIKILGYNGTNHTELVPEAIDTGLPIRVIGSENKSSGNKNHGFTDLKKISLPEGIVEIQAYTFEYTFLEEINFPSTIKQIGKQAFFMSHLKEAIILEGLTVLEANTFMLCHYLIRVTLPNTIKEIKESAFSCCGKLAEITLPTELEFLENQVFTSCHSLEEIILPSKLKKVGEKVFSGCNKLKKVILENDTVDIDQSAFRWCKCLEFIGTEGGENLLHKFNLK